VKRFALWFLLSTCGRGIGRGNMSDRLLAILLDLLESKEQTHVEMDAMLKCSHFYAQPSLSEAQLLD
jgi:hypothetical protein